MGDLDLCSTNLRPRHRIFEERLAEVHRGSAQIGRGRDFLLRHPTAVLISAREECHETGHRRRPVDGEKFRSTAAENLPAWRFLVDDFDVEMLTSGDHG